MDHAVDESVLDACDRSQGAANLQAKEIEKVTDWLDAFLSDSERKLAIDEGFSLWSAYKRFDPSNHGLLVLQSKLDKDGLRLVPVPVSNSGDVSVPLVIDPPLDGYRRWLYSIVSQRPSDLSIANATHEGWHTKPPGTAFAGVEIEHILHSWLHATVTAKQIAANTSTQQAYHIPPARLQGSLAAAVYVGVGTNGRKAWEHGGRRYEFDRQHGTVEVWAIGSGTWLHEARLDGTITKTTGGKGRWGR